MKSSRPKPVTLEDLLQLKRAEKPSPEFWAKFERDLRAKQLAAIVVQRPWWQRLPNLFGGLSRYYLPMGATAALAMTVLGVRQYHASAPTSTKALDAPTSASVFSVAEKAPPSAQPSVPGFAAISSLALPGVSDEPSQPAAQTVAVTKENYSAPTFGASAVTALSGGLIGADLSLPAGRNTLRGFITQPSGFESRALPARSPVVEPLAQMTPPSEMRRARFLVGAISTGFSSADSPSRTSERHAKRLADERPFESVGRYSLAADRLKIGL